MTDRQPATAARNERNESADLAERLANYRSRVAREGRKAALQRLDRAIDEARRSPRKGSEGAEP